MKGLPETLDLGRLGVDPAGIAKVALIHKKGGTCLYRVQCDRRSVVIKWFADAPGSSEIRSYMLLEKLGVPMLPVHGEGDNAIVLEDLAVSPTWRLATEADCDCAVMGRAVAAWYRVLHEAGREWLVRVGVPPTFLRREEDGLDPEAIHAIGEKLGLSHLQVWRLCANHIEAIKQAIDARANAPLAELRKTLCMSGHVIE